MQLSDYERAVHEAAHAVVAREFGFELVKTLIYPEEECPEGDPGGCTQLVAQDLVGDDGGRRHVIYCLAGMEYQDMVTHDRAKAEQGGWDDVRQAWRGIWAHRQQASGTELPAEPPDLGRITGAPEIMNQLRAATMLSERQDRLNDEVTRCVNDLRPCTRKLLERPDIRAAIEKVAARLQQEPHVLCGNKGVDDALAEARVACRLAGNPESDGAG